MKHYCDACSRCPYYLHEDRQLIYCEGVVPGTVVHLAFANCLDQKEYKRTYCRSEWKSCQIAQMLAQKYEEDNDYEYAGKN